ncbi:MAG: DUF882 domain-containing protein [Thermodesulfovibrionia bacterium]|nr:DUF882 domain-containing protein [Thermodesulfovibrionia bacterium]
MRFSEKGFGTLKRDLSRRNFIKFGILAAAASLAPGAVFASRRVYLPHEKSLAFYNIHTGEGLRATYWSQGKYLSDAMDDINYIMRDYRTNEIRPIDAGLLDFLHAIGSKLDIRHNFYIISGYRCPATNEFLRRNGKGVDKNSLHMYGKAVDIRVPRCDISTVRSAALNLRYGGVGYYPDSNFVHVDVGNVRSWRFPF